MAGGAQLVVAGHVDRTAERHLFLRVVQPESRLHAAIRRARHAAGGQRVGTAAFPVGEIDLGVLVQRGAGRVDQLEQAAAFEVGAYRRGDDLGGGGIAGKIGDGDRNPVGTGAGNFNGKLGIDRSRGQKRQHNEEFSENLGHGTRFLQQFG